MSITEIPQTTSRREMRKALIRLRMEMHRQEIRHESQQLMLPLNKVRNMGSNWQDSLGIKHAPLWGVGVVTLLGFLTGKGAKGGGIGTMTRLVRLGPGLIPLSKLAMHGATRKSGVTLAAFSHTDQAWPSPSRAAPLLFRPFKEAP